MRGILLFLIAVSNINAEKFSYFDGELKHAIFMDLGEVKVVEDRLDSVIDWSLEETKNIVSHACAYAKTVSGSGNVPQDIVDHLRFQCHEGKHRVTQILELSGCQGNRTKDFVATGLAMLVTGKKLTYGISIRLTRRSNNWPRSRDIWSM